MYCMSHLFWPIFDIMTNLSYYFLVNLNTSLDIICYCPVVREWLLIEKTHYEVLITVFYIQLDHLWVCYWRDKGRHAKATCLLGRVQIQPAARESTFSQLKISITENAMSFWLWQNWRYFQHHWQFKWMDLCFFTHCYLRVSCCWNHYQCSIPNACYSFARRVWNALRICNF